MAAKPTLDELYRRLADPACSEAELRPLLRLDPDRSLPFAPVVALDPAAVDLPGRTRSALALDLVNGWARARRDRAFERRLADPAYRGPVIVSEGDSWFQYPILLADVIDHLSERYAIKSLDAGGDTLARMLADDEALTAIERTGATILLLSAGGNDLLAGGELAGHLLEADPLLAPEAHLKPSFDAVLADVCAGYHGLLARIAAEAPQVRVICHGYDVPIPAGGRWLGRPMASRGILDPATQRGIARAMMDRFNAALAEVCGRFAHAVHVDCRGAVGDGRWHDELHPTDAGFAAVAARIEAAIGRAAPGDGRRTRSMSWPRGHTAKGLSLHIGLDAVDPDHYLDAGGRGWDGVLGAGEADARAMACLARAQGFDAALLLTGEATRCTVTQAIARIAGRLASGDMFLLSYAGHGSQLPDLDGDEAALQPGDRLDETWCLHDAQLLDDEIAGLLARFAPGVRVLVVSDSCHSGSITRAPGRRTRAMPTPVAAAVARRHRTLYAAIRTLAGAGERTAASCTVQLLAACRADETALENGGHGLFTAALLEVWNEGRFEGDYGGLIEAIRARMPGSQHPVQSLTGAQVTAFLCERPFRI